jgi:hypothetical protein
MKLTLLTLALLLNSNVNAATFEEEFTCTINGGEMNGTKTTLSTEPCGKENRALLSLSLYLPETKRLTTTTFLGTSTGEFNFKSEEADFAFNKDKKTVTLTVTFKEDQGQYTETFGLRNCSKEIIVDYDCSETNNSKPNDIKQ